MARLHNADLDWRDGKTPESRQFGDIYFSPKDGLAETRHVFLDGIGAPDIWAGRDCFTIGETGFGTGLNFLATWAAWRKKAAPSSRLNFLSVEGFPLSGDALGKALSVWAEFSELTENLVDLYPEIHPGFHRLSFDDGRVTLTLLFGEVEEMLSRVEGQVDAWYLDGFAPSKNPDMWRPAVFQQLARLSKPGARLATFTAAGQVRRDLTEAGFAMQKAPGFGYKRECLRGAFEGEVHAYTGKPWFAPAPAQGIAGPVAVIGGGVAGLTVARRLRQAGADVTVYERDRLGAVGSGNRVGLIQPRLTAADSLDGRFNAAAYLHACRHYDQMEAAGKTSWVGPRGVLQLARDDEEAERFMRLVAEERLPGSVMQPVTGDAASDLAGIPLDRPGLWFPHGGGLKPRAVLEASARDLSIFEQATIAGLEQSEGGWVLRDPGGNVLQETQAVILANGPFACDLWPIADLPLVAKRGQVVHLAASEASRKLKVGLSFGRYLSPAVEEAEGCFHVSGASFNLWEGMPEDEDWRQLRDEDEAEILQDVRGLSRSFADLPALPNNPGRAGLRASIIDHLPAVGAVHDGAYFDQAYGDLHHGRRQSGYGPARYLPGLYAMTGLGSRGFQTAPLLADMLVDQMLGAPLPVPRDVTEALHTGRFQIRRLRRPPKR